MYITYYTHIIASVTNTLHLQYMMSTIKCEKCNVRVPKHRPFLFCTACKQLKHYKCNYLTRSEALAIMTSECSLDWACYDCRLEILPLECAVSPSSTQHTPSAVINNSRPPCSACTKQISKTPVSCSWCDNLCHKKCVKNSLGCTNCCNSIIPGYNYTTFELIGQSYFANTVFNPFDMDLLINQVGTGRSHDGPDENFDLLGC